MLSILPLSLVEEIHDRFYIEGNRGGSISLAAKKSVILFAKRACTNFNINSNLKDGIFTETIRCDKYIRMTLKHFTYPGTQIRLVEEPSTISEFEELKQAMVKRTTGVDLSYLRTAFANYSQTLKKYMGSNFVYEIRKLRDDSYCFLAECSQPALSIEVSIDL